MNWRTPVYWFFCKINDPIWSPSLFGKCLWCGKVHGKADAMKRAHIELGRCAYGLQFGIQDQYQIKWIPFDDGVGVVGWNWICPICRNYHKLDLPDDNDLVTCSLCGTKFFAQDPNA